MVIHRHHPLAAELVRCRRSSIPGWTDKDASAYSRLLVSDERFDTVSELRSEQAGVERTQWRRTVHRGCRISHRNRFAVASYSMDCYGIGEMPSPNHKGWRTAVVRTAMTRIPMGPHSPRVLTLEHSIMECGEGCKPAFG